MDKITYGAFQGDVAFIKVDEIPANAKPINSNEPYVVAHSETGHHHTIDCNGVVMFDVGDPMVCYLRIDGDDKPVIHHRPFHTHAPVMLEGGGTNWMVRRQREYTPEGWRRVED